LLRDRQAEQQFSIGMRHSPVGGIVPNQVEKVVPLARLDRGPVGAAPFGAREEVGEVAGDIIGLDRDTLTADQLG